MTDRRLDKEYWTWRAAVVKRDGHKCQYPSCRRRTKLEVHHIIPWSASASLRYEVSNGICLCRAHHHSIKGNESLYSRMFNTIVSAKDKKKKK